MLKSVTQRVPAALVSRGRSVSQFRPRYGAFINGKEVFPDSNEFFKVYAPATDEVLCEVASTDKKALNDAVEVADEVYRSGIWSRADVRHRANVLSAISVELKAAIPELLELEVAQTGRAVREMKAQVNYAFYFPYYSFKTDLIKLCFSWAAFRSGSTTLPPWFARTKEPALPFSETTSTTCSVYP